MKIFASGEAQRLLAPGEYMPCGSYGRVIGLINLGDNNGQNDFGWSGLKAVIELEGVKYVLDFPEHSRLVTDDGVELTPSDDDEASVWWPNRNDLERYGLRWIELTI